MNKIILVLSFICFTNLATAQFGSRILYKEQSSESFVLLKYITLKDSVGYGYGFPNPTGYKSIVFSESKPSEPKTKDWSILQVKYVELYEEKSSNDLINLVFSKSQRDSIKANNERPKASFQIDTVKIFHLRKMRGGVAAGLNTFLYENDEIRLFGSVVWDNYYAPHQLVFFQTTELPVFDSQTYFLNYNSHKAFKRTAKRVFKKCPKILNNIDNGAYFPKHKSNLKKFADDYALLCSN